ncbi:hypothetical protein OS493_024402 [Desmophyllum pertusum]|uniref:Sulfotransferase domain-containing protein n=1 Tax=Desmophyllum pertusum TaxID=174260 RepID=A0A9W9YLP3_9CNID|nr:hypothetical protein OS493_024402 [Desmophyllum pertusum]
MLRKTSRCRVFLFYFVSILLATTSLIYLLHKQLQSEDVLNDFTATEIKQSYDTSPLSDIFYINITENKLSQRLPNALIIGIGKGGTRAALVSISRHPMVRACSREVHFFDHQENYQLGLDWYQNQMPLSLKNHITIEKTPAYFITEDAPRLVYKMSPSVKLLVAVRDPTVRAISDYAQLYEKSHGELRPFEEYVTRDSQHQVLETRRSMVTSGIYVKHLKKWMEYFPLEQIHFINGKELVKNTVHEMQSVENFLGLEPFIDETLYYFNETKGFPCLVPAPQMNGEQPDSGCLSEAKGRPHPLVDEDVVTLLRDFYRPFNEEFYSAVGKNYGWP